MWCVQEWSGASGHFPAVLLIDDDESPAVTSAAGAGAGQCGKHGTERLGCWCWPVSQSAVVS